MACGAAGDLSEEVQQENLFWDAPSAQRMSSSHHGWPRHQPHGAASLRQPLCRWELPRYVHYNSACRTLGARIYPAHCKFLTHTMLSLFSGLAVRYLKWRYPLPQKDAAQAPPITFPIFVYAHRGGNLERSAVSGERYIENTLPAFRNALRVGADLLELDVQITRDGKVVLFHDNDLGRMCGEAYRGKRVADFTAAELPPLLRHPGAMYPPLEKKAPANASSGIDDLQQAFTSPAEGDPALGAAAASAVQGNGVTPTPPTSPPRPAQPSKPSPVAPTVPTAPTAPDPDEPDWCRIPLLEEVLREIPDTPLQVGRRLQLCTHTLAATCPVCPGGAGVATTGLSSRPEPRQRVFLHMLHCIIMGCVGRLSRPTRHSCLLCVPPACTWTCLTGA